MINALATPKEKSLMHLNAIKQKASNTKSAVRTPRVSFQIIAKNNDLIFEAILFSANLCCLTAVKFSSIILVARIVSFKKANKQADETKGLTLPYLKKDLIPIWNELNIVKLHSPKFKLIFIISFKSNSLLQ